LTRSLGYPNGRYLRIAAVHRAVFERPPAQARD
jgi:hypothetical protein